MADRHRPRRGVTALLSTCRTRAQPRDDVPVTSVTDQREHRVADWRYAAAIDDGSGRCVAVCGRLVAAAALAAPAGQRCLDCVVEHWRQIAVLQSDLAAFRHSVRVVAEIVTGEPTPEGEPFEVTRRKAGM